MRRVGVTALGALALLALWLASPLPDHGLESRMAPAMSHAEGLRKVDSLQAVDSPGIAAECGTRLFDHGSRTPRVIVLFHGLTNCPAQFDSLARMSFARGANVLVPRLPRHGFADHMTDELARADASELRRFTDRVLDAAHGLGDSVTVVGLSVGGTLAAWAAQERPDVDRAVVIAPLLGVNRAPGAWTPVVTRLALAMPNQFVWWDSKRQQDLPGPKHVYPRFSTRSIAATLMLGAAAREHARRKRPAARSLVMVTVGGDIAVDNALCTELVRSWRGRGARDVVDYEFPASLHLNHDVVDPEQVGGNPAVTYPVLMQLIDPRAAAETRR